MGISIGPEILLARRVLQRKGLTPSIDVERLVREYAELQIRPLPFEGVDGICLDLKVPGKTPRVIVNALNPPSRQRFTMAHELGHILIPWHTGTILDSLDSNSSNQEYENIEQEANIFAAELLMPDQWIKAQLADQKNLARCHRNVAELCEVSAHAAAIRIAQYLPGNFIYAIEREGHVEVSGRTLGTLASALSWGERFAENAFSYSTNHFTCKYEGKVLHWWALPEKIELEQSDAGDWRYLLNKIILDLGCSAEAGDQLKRSINGVIAYANGSAKQQGNHNAETVVAAAIQRLSGREQYEQFIAHPLCRAFLTKKAQELTEID